MNNSTTLSFKLDRQEHIIADLHQELLRLKSAFAQFEAALNDLSVIADELVSNVLKYSQTETGTLVFTFKMQVLDGRLQCQLTDNGSCFDPFAAEEPDLDIPVVEREIGGLGLLLVHHLAHNGRYYSKNGLNFTEFYIPIESNAE